MRVFVPINGNKRFESLCRQYPDRLGYIISPSYYLRPKEGIPFILDNDAFGCWKRAEPFNESAWLKMMDKIERTGLRPEWVVIPDVVCDAAKTIQAWDKYSPMVPDFPKAFVLQDGMRLDDVPDSSIAADVYFVGGSDSFKWCTAIDWCQCLNRVHIGRVRSKKVHYCEKIGAESCDGSGWLRESCSGRPYRQLEAWVMRCNHQYDLSLSTPSFSFT